MTPITGLTSSEVEQRRQKGEGNDIKLSTSRPYKDIILTNVFNPINIVLYAIGFGMALVGDYRSAFSIVMLVVFNAVIGIIRKCVPNINWKNCPACRGQSDGYPRWAGGAG